MTWLGLLTAAFPALAEPQDGAATPPIEETPVATETCLIRELAAAGDDVTVGMLRKKCAAEAEQQPQSLLLERVRREEVAEAVPPLLAPHERTYFLPLSYVSSPNEDPFEDASGAVPQEDQLDNLEAKFQISFKFSLAGNLLTHRDRLYAGLTTLSFWQAYNRNVSAPFRETDYQPELFWSVPLDWGPWGLDASVLTFGVSHQSNGRGGNLSRSWNRIYAKAQFEKDNLVVSVKPWWRIPEDRKSSPTDATGDDNPDIERYLGHMELETTYRHGRQEWSVMVRGNPDSGKGAVRLEWAFPLWRGMRGYAQYFNGYGESLIDYNAHIERIGVGILLTDLL